jgi:hypothetical protein
MRDERLVLGLVLFHLLAAAPGMALLHALGLVRLRPWPLMAAAGPAVLLGLVVAGIPLIVLAVLGAPLNAVTAVATVTAVTLVLLLLGRRTRARLAPPPPDTGVPRFAERPVEWVVLGGAALYFVVGARGFMNVQTLWDDANIWSLKALGMFHFEGLVDGLSRNPDLSGVHLDYPILQPLVEANFFRAIGGVDLRLWHAELWLLLMLVVWTLAWLLAPLGRRWLWTVVLATLALSGIPIANITLGDADLLMAGLTGCATLSFGIWLERGTRAHAILGAVFLAGAANVKNEGLVFGVAVAVALCVAATFVDRRGRWRDLGLSAAIVAVAVMPWQIWVLGNDAATRATPSPWQVIDDPGYLIDRRDFLWRGLGQVIGQLTNADWNLLIPAFVITAVVLIVAARRRVVAAFYLGAGFLAYLSVAYVYWVTPFSDLGGFEQRTGDRIVLGVVFIAGAGLAHLLELASWPRAEEPVAEPAAAEPAEAAV